MEEASALEEYKAEAKDARRKLEQASKLVKQVKKNRLKHSKASEAKVKRRAPQARAGEKETLLLLAETFLCLLYWFTCFTRKYKY